MDNNSQPPNQDLNGMSQQPVTPYQQFTPPPQSPYTQPMVAQIENPNENRRMSSRL